MPLRIAHRGASAEYPENTLPAFRRALELGADGIELDVHCTSDRQVVVHHDPIPRASARERSLNGRPIAALTLGELRSFEIAPGVGIPTLAEVMELVEGRATLFVELKGEGIEREVAALLRPTTPLCAVHSFDHAAIARFAHLAPEIRRGVLFDGQIERAAEVLRDTGALDLWPHWPLVDEGVMATARRAGARVIAWTVNDARDAARLARLGVDGLCGDDIRRLPES